MSLVKTPNVKLYKKVKNNYVETNAALPIKDVVYIETTQVNDSEYLKVKYMNKSTYSLKSMLGLMLVLISCISMCLVIWLLPIRTVEGVLLSGLVTFIIEAVLELTIAKCIPKTYYIKDDNEFKMWQIMHNEDA